MIVWGLRRPHDAGLGIPEGFHLGIQIRIEELDAILSGTLPDQSALHGILNRVCDLGLTAIAVRRLRFGESGATQPHIEGEGGESLTRAQMRTPGSARGLGERGP